MAPGEASTYPPPLLPHAAHARQLSRAVRARGHRPLPARTACSSPSRRPRCRCSSTSMAGYAFAKLRFAGRDRMFRVLLGALVIPGQVAMLPLFLLLKQLGLVNTYGGVIVPAHGEHLRHLPRAPVRAVDSRRAARGGAHRRRERVRASSASIVVPLLKPILVDAGDLHVPRHVERLHVAADRADRRASSTRCRSRWPSLSREHVQDNELMMAGSVLTMLPVLLVFLVPAALLHPGPDGGQRQGMRRRSVARHADPCVGVRAPARCSPCCIVAFHCRVGATLRAQSSTASMTSRRGRPSRPTA